VSRSAQPFLAAERSIFGLIMNTKEKIGRATDTTVLCLHKEGIFYKLYDRHAMLFTENIKSLKIKTRFIKAAGQQVYSCGKGNE
jgi:hypothetical protein